MLFEMGECPEQLYCTDAFERSHDIDGCNALVCFQENMDMVVHRLERFDLVTIVVCYVGDDLLELSLGVIV